MTHRFYSFFIASNSTTTQYRCYNCSAHHSTSCKHRAIRKNNSKVKRLYLERESDINAMVHYRAVNVFGQISNNYYYVRRSTKLRLYFFCSESTVHLKNGDGYPALRLIQQKKSWKSINKNKCDFTKH